jgi:hypothetical protein
MLGSGLVWLLVSSKTSQVESGLGVRGMTDSDLPPVDREAMSK